MEQSHKESLKEHLDMYKKAIDEDSITKMVVIYLDNNDDVGVIMAGFKRKHELVGVVHVGLESILESVKETDAEDADKVEVAV